MATKSCYTVAMRRAFVILVIVFGFIFSASTLAWADDERLSSARQMFLNGQYASAMDIGKDLGTAEGLSLAAESMSAQVLLGQVKKRRKTATKARKLAQKALKKDPASHTAIMQYALARGFETQASSPMRVWRKGLIKKSRVAIEAVQKNIPEDPRGDALMGAWHLGIVRRAGADRAEDWFEATEAEGIAFYDSALTQSPDDITILTNFAVTLLAIDPVRHADKAKNILTHTLAQESSNALEAAMLERAKRLMGYFGNSEDLQSVAEAILDDENDDEETE